MRGEKIKRTLAPFGDVFTGILRRSCGTDRDNSHFSLDTVSPLYTQVINAYSCVCGALNVKYFFMGISVMVIVWAGTFALMI